MEAIASPELVFETLVAGNENILAISGALKVLEQPGDRYNPLFIFGPPSVGKTHLLQAIRQRFEDDQPDWNVLAIPAGEFLEECENAWQNKTTVEFRQQLWRLHVLLIDDIHLLVRRPAALEELYHAFNRLVADSRQLIFTSRFAPAELTDLPLSLRSRFQSGLVVSLDPPRDRLLQDIVERKCVANGLKPSRKATRLMCQELRSVRDLHGVLHQLGEPSSQDEGAERRICLQEIRAVLDQHAARQLTIADVTRVVCHYLHVDVTKVRSASRQASLVQARQLAMYLAREMTRLPLTEIGRYFGGRDHTTVLYAYRKVTEDLRSNPFLAKADREIRAALRG